MKKAVTFVVPAILVLFGLTLMASYLLAVKSASRSNQWTQTRATIEKVAAGTSEPLDVIYRYEVAGHEYRSTLVTLGTISKSDVPSRLQRYTVGRTVLIYVNPTNPAEAVLELGQHPGNWRLLAGWFFIYLGIATAIVLWWRNKRSLQKRVRRPGRPMSRLKPPQVKRRDAEE
jgi:hypothetical protein